MSDAAPTRTISGFGAPRARTGGVRPDASRLIARNRTQPPATPLEATPDVTTRRADGPPAPAARLRTSAKEQLNVAVPHDVRARIRAAYRATAVAEGHRTFADLIASLLEAEANRLERQYNGGVPFADGDRPLPAGRPLGPD